MPDVFAAQRDIDRGQAIRTLLAHPVIDGNAHPERFSLVAGHRSELVAWFDEALGWSLRVDGRGRWARLDKRSRIVDSTRPARRARGARQPFDARRYQLLCVACAELASHPVTTLGMLADGIRSACASDEQIHAFDSSRHGERKALIDALKLLERWGVLAVSAGSTDEYLADRRNNAIVEADTARLHRLLACATPPSTVPHADPGDITVEEAVDLIVAEPWYEQEALVASVGETAHPLRLRRVRHELARRLLDDPVLHVDELDVEQREYLGNPSGRRWLLDRAREAGFHVEQRSEGWIAIDPEQVATDDAFPAGSDNAKQAALLLADELVARERRDAWCAPIDRARLVARCAQLLEQHPGWARQYQDAGGAEALMRAAVEILVRHGLAEWVDQDAVRGRPALARYRAGDPVVTRPAQRSIFDEPEMDDDWELLT